MVLSLAQKGLRKKNEPLSFQFMDYNPQCHGSYLGFSGKESLYGKWNSFKGQEISKGNCGALNFPKKQQFFTLISALASRKSN